MSNLRKLTADEIECRVAQVTAKGVTLLLYKTARVDRAILTETYGNKWQNDFKVIDGKMYGGIGVYDTELKEWLWRWDCGVESNTEAEKGQASDCFKRAGFKWGIGIELYSAPFIFVSCETEYNQTKKKYEQKDKYAKYSVKEIGYSDKGDINSLIIVDSNGKQVYKMGEYKKPDEKVKLADIMQDIKGCQTEEELQDMWKTFYQVIDDTKGLRQACADRKAEIKEAK